jgi:hypothetical protein
LLLYPIQGSIIEIFRILRNRMDLESHLPLRDENSYRGQVRKAFPGGNANPRNMDGECCILRTASIHAV